MKKRVVLIIVGIIVIAAIAFGAFYYWFYTKTCTNLECFNSALEKCSRASYISEAVEASYLYNIKGKSAGECVVDVTLLQLKKGDVNYQILEGKSMTCSFPLGMVIRPETNLDKCHGLLKEELQTLIIEKLHNYVLNNIGKIEEELNKPL